MAVFGLDEQLQQLKMDSQPSLSSPTDRVDTASSANDLLTNTSSYQREFSSVKKQNDQIKELNEKLQMELNELKVKMKLQEEKIKMYEDYIQQMQNGDHELPQEGNNPDDDENSEGSQMFKMPQNSNNKHKSRNRQILMNFQKDNQEESLQKRAIHNVQRFSTAEPKPTGREQPQTKTSPFGRQKHNDSFECMIETYSGNPEQANIRNKPREGSVTSPAKLPVLYRKYTQEITQDKLIEQFYHASNPINPYATRLNTQKEEVKQVKVEKTDQIVALGYEHLKEGQNFKPKAHMAMMKEKRLRRGHNNSSQDVNFLMKEIKLNNFKNNIEQKTFSQNLYGNLLQVPYQENSDYFLPPKDNQIGNGIGLNNINVIYSDQPSQTNIPSNNQSHSNQKDNSHNNTSSSNTPQNTVYTNPQNINLAAASNSPNATNLNFPKLNRQQSQAPPLTLPSLNFIPVRQVSLNTTTNNIHNNQILNQSVEQNPFSSNDIDTSALNSEDSNLRTIIVVNEQDPEIVKYEQEVNRFQKLYNDMKQYGSLGDFLFEEFMLIGPDLRELKALVEEQPSPFTGIKGSCLEYTKGKAQQSILFSKPSYISPFVCEKRQAVAQFAFPTGLQYYRYRSQADLQNMPARFKDILLMNLCQQKDSGISDNMFVLNIRGEEANMNNHNSLSSINPNSILYAVCYQQEDLLVVQDEKTGEKTIFLFPTVYCFLTYYPFVDYFLQILLEIVNRIKTIRLVKSSFSGIIDNNLQNADLEQVIKTLQIDRDLCMSLRTLQIKEVLPDRVISYYLNAPKNYMLLPDKYGDERYSTDDKERRSSYQTPQSLQWSTSSYRVPSLEEMGYIEGFEAAYLTFSNLPYYDFQIILSLIMLEKKVVFLSKNITILTLTTLTFQTLFKPLKYPHPVIFSISDDLMYFLEAPVPIIVGVNINAEKFEYQYGYNNECYYVDLDKNLITTKNPMSISKIESQKYKFTNYKSQIKPLFKEINNEITSKQLGNKFKKLIQRSHHDKKLIYKPDNKQLGNLKSLLQLIRKSFQESIIQKLPNNPIFQDENQSQLDMGEIQKAVLKDNPEYSFLQHFVETQIFYYFMEQRYF